MQSTGNRAVVPLVLRPRTRAGWIAAAAVALLLGSASTGVVVMSAGRVYASLPLTVLMAGGYLWLGLGALDVARSRSARLEIGPDRLAIVHDGLLREPLIIERAAVEAVTLDLRARDDRRAAAAVRRGGIVRPSFLDPRIPVVSAAASSHSLDGTAVAPNMVVMLRRPVRAPRIPLAARVLLRLTQGKTGRYRGPKPGDELRGIRLAVADADAAGNALASWDVLTTLARDERYLMPIAEADHAKAGRRRAILIAGVGAIVILFGALELLARR